MASRMYSETDAEIVRLRTALRDLVAMSAIPVAWLGRDPPGIAAGVADVLTGSLDLDFAFVRLCVPTGGIAVEVSRGSAWKTFPEWLEAHLASAGHLSRKEIVADVRDGGKTLRGLVVPVGIDAEGGLVAAACDRPDFPTEIDQLLLGPRGLFAIEVKNLNATVDVDGDRWRADKYDNYGNLVEQRPIADRMGRSPSVQLNEPADDLGRFLAERGQPAELQRVVVLAHRRSGLGRVRNPTVLALASPADLLTLIGNSASRLDRGQRAAIGALIRRDHEFHGGRRRTGPGPPR